MNPDTSPDPAAILAALGLPSPVHTEPVSGGADTRIWRVRQGSATFALRLFRPEQAAAFEREISAMRAASDAGLPVPRIHAADRWQDHPAMLLDWMPGEPLQHGLRAHPQRAWALGRAFGRAQAHMHQAPLPPLLQQEPHAWMAMADLDAGLLGRLRQAACPAPTALLHLDYHPLNVLVGDRQISAILDWTNARAGDPRADLARTATILRFTPALGSDPSPLHRLARTRFTAGWRRGYREVAGPAHGMAPFHAWAGFAMVRDLAPRLGRPDLPWLTREMLEAVQDWSEQWHDRAVQPDQVNHQDEG